MNWRVPNVLSKMLNWRNERLPALYYFMHAEYHAMMPSGEKTNVENAMHHPLTRYRCLITNAGEKGLLLS